MRSDDLQGAKALREASGCTHSASFALRLPISFTVDRTSNRKWKRIRNYRIVMCRLAKLNGSGRSDVMLARVLATRAGIDRIKAKELVDALFEMNLDE